MKTRIVRIGNSRGVRIPKPILEEAGLEDEVEVQVTDSGLVIQAANRPRAGWAEAAQALGEGSQAGLLDEPVSTAFDESEWVW